ncbi:MAG: hypothetical protein K6F77_00240 [Lachnospiraceae bacterium]|nr:hypothetical protein [Lachnospiraceae bacterium]
MKEFEIIDDVPFLIKGNVTKNDVFTAYTYLNSFVSFFNNPQKIEDDGVEFSIGLQNTNVESIEVMDSDDMVYFSEFFKSHYDKFNANIASLNAPKGSYRWKIINILKQNMDMVVDGDFSLLNEFGLKKEYTNYTDNFSLAFPLPQFVVEDNEGHRREVTDYDRYERYLATTKFYEVIEDRQNYFKKTVVPYLKDRKAGKVNEQMEKEYKSETYQHLYRQKKYLESIMAVKKEGETKNIYPFSSHEGGTLELDWQGERFGATRLEKVNKQIKFLDLGWSPEDFPMLDDIDAMWDEINNHKDEIATRDYLKLQGVYNKFMNTSISSIKERHKALDSIRPIFRKYNEVAPAVNSISETFEDKVKNDYEPIVVSGDEEARRDTIKKLEELSKGLNAQHRGSLKEHRDRADMVNLKNKIKETLDYLKDRGNRIYDNNRVSDLFLEIRDLADTYVKAKRHDAEERIRLEAENEEEALAEIEEWRPKTKMGVTRFESALNLKSECQAIANSFSSVVNARNDLKGFTDELIADNRKVMHAEDLILANNRFYDNGVKQIINYYSKDPMFIPEHCGENSKMYTKEQFREQFKRIDVDGISNEDFALVSYAAVMDHNTINPEDGMKKWNHKQYSYVDSFYRNRTMFTLDMALTSPRASMSKNFLGFTLVPARNRAKEAIEAYNNGDKSLLADIMAKGMEEINKECYKMGDISIQKGHNFAYNTELLSKMINFTKKDPELYAAVKERMDQKDPEIRELITDNMRLKRYLDESLDSRAKLEKAAKMKTPLSPAVKKECINKIVRYEIVAYTQNINNQEMIDTNPAVVEYRETLSDKIMHPDKYDVTMEDIHIGEQVLVNEAIKPVRQIYHRLRSQKGRNQLGETTLEITSDFNPGISERNILRDLDKLDKKISDIHSKSILEIRNKTKQVEAQVKQKNAQPKAQPKPKGPAM